MSIETLAREFGVTRLARLTGLDRLGVEVVGAVRPRGHVLQVSQGKGRSLVEAQWSALSEAIELSAAEQPDPRALVFGHAPGDTWFDVGDLKIAWVAGRELHSGQTSWAPAEAVFCPPAGQVWLGPSVTRWKSNGLGAHPRARAFAEEHAVLELLERHCLAQTLPDGWTPSAMRRHFVRTLHTADGFAAFSFDLTPDDSALHVAGVLLFDLEEGPVPLTAGYACRRAWAGAEESAFLEAAQSRLTEIHGAREDVMIGQRETGKAALAVCRALPQRWVRRSAVRHALARCVDARVLLVTLRESPWVVKAISPDLAVSELL